MKSGLTDCKQEYSQGQEVTYMYLGKKILTIITFLPVFSAVLFVYTLIASAGVLTENFIIILPRDHR